MSNLGIDPRYSRKLIVVRQNGDYTTDVDWDGKVRTEVYNPIALDWEPATGGGSPGSNVEVTNFPASYPVTGALTDTQLRASAVPVSATALPLPTGASTEATVLAMSAKLGPFTTMFDSTTTASVTYVGKATPGSATSSSVWQIKKIDGTSVTFAGGVTTFTSKWTDRASLSYS